MSSRPNLLPALKRCIRSEEWDSSSYDEFDYVHVFGRAQQALLMAAVFVPKFIDLDSSILLAQAVRDHSSIARFQKSKQNSSMTLEDLEASFNRVEVPYLFLPSGQDIPDNEWRVLAELIAHSWRAQLTFKYPSRHFVVRVEPAEGEDEIAVTFHEVRSKKG